MYAEYQSILLDLPNAGVMVVAEVPAPAAAENDGNGSAQNPIDLTESLWSEFVEQNKQQQQQQEQQKNQQQEQGNGRPANGEQASSEHQQEGAQDVENEEAGVGVGGRSQKAASMQLTELQAVLAAAAARDDQPAGQEEGQAAGHKQLTAVLAAAAAAQDDQPAGQEQAQAAAPKAAKGGRKGGNGGRQRRKRWTAPKRKAPAGQGAVRKRQAPIRKKPVYEDDPDYHYYPCPAGQVQAFERKRCALLSSMRYTPLGWGGYC